MAKKKKFIRKFHINWKSFFSGLAIGLAIAFLLFYFVGHRYEIKSGGPSGIYTIKSDKWTGKSWILRYYKDNKQNFITEFYWEIISTDKWQRYIIEEPKNAKQKGIGKDIQQKALSLIETLREAGFSDQEIFEWMEKEKPKLKKNGATDEEIAEYFFSKKRPAEPGKKK